MGLKLHEAETELREIAKETGLITEEREGETFRFIHLTFCEFLAAYESALGRANGWSELIQQHRAFRSDKSPALRTRLIEVLPFACALLPRHMKRDALTQVSEIGDDRVGAVRNAVGICLARSPSNMKVSFQAARSIG
jgi:hypothetical protein